MRYLIMFVPLLITYHGLSYALWAWRQGNKPGGIGMTFFTMFTLAVVTYMVFFHQSY